MTDVAMKEDMVEQVPTIHVRVLRGWGGRGVSFVENTVMGGPRCQGLLDGPGSGNQCRSTGTLLEQRKQSSMAREKDEMRYYYCRTHAPSVIAQKEQGKREAREVIRVADAQIEARTQRIADAKKDLLRLVQEAVRDTLPPAIIEALIELEVAETV